MLDSLRRIHNPLARGATAAATLGSAMTIAAVITLGVTQSKAESAHRTAVYASLLGIGGGAIAGLLTPPTTSQRSPAAQGDPSAKPLMAQSSWTDWRNFVVVRKVKESEEITSFYLQPEDKGAIPNFQPGQFLTIKLTIPGQAKPVIRTYSLSDYTEPCDYYRLSIKREPMPKGLDVPPGIASNFMHDQIQEGSVIPAKPPSGRFVLDVQKSLPAVLISNGVGITPMISMAKAVTRLNPTRPLWFLHGARDGSFHAFRDEVMAIAQQNPHLAIHIAYSRPRPEDQGYYHTVGYIDAPLVQSLVMQDAEYFLCGSPAFMDSLRAGLRSAGVPDSQVFFEMFTKAAKSTTTPDSKETVANTGATITFARSQRVVSWDETANNLLEFAEAQKLEPDYSCRQGICGTCQCKLLEGDVEYQTAPTAAIDDGSVLICIAKPKTSTVILDL